MTRLILFDLDRTLVEFNQTELLPDVLPTLARQPEGTVYALCTNQGGVGYRLWLESVENPWDDPKKYPTEAEIRERIAKVVENLGIPIKVYVCFAYQSKKSGKWGPVPEGCELLDEWSYAWRKPAPGMLHRAIHDAQLSNGKLIDKKLELGKLDSILFVGDGVEDMGAADNAGVNFVTAERFFGRDIIPF